MKNPYTILRIISGFIFTVAGLSKLGITPNLLSRPDMFTPEAFSFLTALVETGYMFPTVGMFAFISGLLILSNRAVPFASVVMFPITLNFALLHIFMGIEINSLFSFELARESLGFIPLALNGYLLYKFRSKYSILFK